MKYIALVAAILGVWVFFGSDAKAYDWNGADIRVATNRAVTYEWGENMCESLIDAYVEGHGNKRVCVNTSGELNFGVYFEDGNWYAVASAPRGGSNYFPILDACPVQLRCRYVAETDTLVAQQYYQGSQRTRLYERISKKLEFSRSERAFRVTSGVQAISLYDISGRHLAVNDYAISQNGQWMIAERLGTGFVVVDIFNRRVQEVSQIDHRKDDAQGAKYSLAISNDGRLAIIGGQNVEFAAIFRTDDCGVSLDTLNMAGMPCATSRLTLDTSVGGMNAVYSPSISPDMSTVKLFVDTLSGQRLVYLRHGTATSGGLRYVALGDSFASGEGETDDAYYLEGTNTLENKCHVSNRSYPYLIAPHFGITPLAVENWACSGSTMKEVKKVSDRLALERPEFITISVGGNDAGLMHKLRDCVKPGICEWALPHNRFKTYEELLSLRPKLIEFYSELVRTSPTTYVNVVGYPLIINENTSCGVDGVLLEPEERRFMNEAIRQLNEVVRSAALQVGAVYRNIETSLNGHRLCDITNTPAMNGLRLGDDVAPVSGLPYTRVIGAESYHPTPYGHVRIANRLRTQGLDSYVMCGGMAVCPSTGYELQSLPYWQDIQYDDSRSRYVASEARNALFVGSGMFASRASVHTQLSGESGIYTFDQSAEERGEYVLNLQEGHIPAGSYDYRIVGEDVTGAYLELYGMVVVEGSENQPEQNNDSEPAEPEVPTPYPTDIPEELTDLDTLALVRDGDVDGVTSLPHVSIPSSNTISVPAPTQLSSNARLSVGGEVGTSRQSILGAHISSTPYDAAAKYSALRNEGDTQGGIPKFYLLLIAAVGTALLVLLILLRRRKVSGDATLSL